MTNFEARRVPLLIDVTLREAGLANGFTFSGEIQFGC